jgi:AhpD family alkylhydroperoxidase
MFATIPDYALEVEWTQFKKLQLEDGPIPNKYRELIGIGISAATKCRYCIYFHVAAAKLFGATDDEIQNAVHFAKQTAGWSTYVNGMQIEFEQFKKEVDQIIEHVKALQNEMI